MKYIIDGHYDILMDVAARRKKGERQVSGGVTIPPSRRAA